MFKSASQEQIDYIRNLMSKLNMDCSSDDLFNLSSTEARDEIQNLLFLLEVRHANMGI